MENGWRLSLYPLLCLHRLAQCLGGKLEPSAGFVATAGVITGIWPLAGIAVKAVTTSELRSMSTHIQYVRAHTNTHTTHINTHTQEYMPMHMHIHIQYTTNENMRTHTRHANTIKIMEVCYIR